MANLTLLTKNKWFIIFGVILLAFLVVVQYKQYSKRIAVEREIQELTKQAQTLEESNKEIQNLVAYLQTDEYKEKAAREQLKLKKEGERVYSFTNAHQPDVLSEQTEAKRSAKSNLEQWWIYLFEAK